MGKFKARIWLCLLTAAILAALIYFGMARAYIPLSQGEPIEGGLLDRNLYAGERRPPNRFYATLWDDFDLAEVYTCFFLGVLCFALGVIRAFNRLGYRRILLLALFSVLFSLMSFSMTEPAGVAPEFLFYLHWASFFLYPAALLLHFFCYLRAALRKWLWPPVLLLAGYAAAAFLMYFVFGLPFDVPERLYTLLSLASAVLYLTVGLFAARDKNAAWYMRGISAYWVVWLVYLAIKAQAGNVVSLHNEFKTAFVVSAALMMCYLLFVNTRELAGYRSGLHMMEIKNDFLQQNYQTLESHFTQIARMKHEMRHHLFAIRTFFKNSDYERLDRYLSDVQAGFAEIEEPVACGNRVIQAVLGHAARRAQDMGFDIGFDVLPLPPLSVPDADLVSLFMNVLDNALESCANVQDAEKRWITVRLKTRPPYLCLSVRNAIGKPDGEKDPVLRGHGVEIVRKIAEKHGGVALFEHTEDTFSAEVALPAI
ncbi:MAG: GHKL domain-containing protein [Oscillospiraceae bacterium]|nr:GHKL domain-containing protein [Oscillospiraceae bacterium]